MTARIDAVSYVSILVLALAVFGVPKAGAGGAIAAIQSGAPGTMYWVGNHRLHLHCTGKGSPTVVFDSGLGGSSLDWVLVQPQVAKFTRACSYDRAGYGWSDSGPRPRDSARISGELEALLGNASVPAPYLLVGHSFGGFNVRLYGHNNPQQVAGLLLIDSSHEDLFERFAAAGVSSSAPRDHSFIIRNAFQIPAAMPADVAATAQSFASSRRNVMAIRSELAHFRESAKQLRIAAKLPEVPVVVVSHRSDKTDSSGVAAQREKIWQELQHDLFCRAAHGKHVIAATADHHVHLREPELIVDAIRNMVDQLD
jgi:pimeloyl-ACP methyl ester carboxylesterase